MAGNRFLDEREAYRILAEGEYGFLSLVTPEGGPYGIPLNYVWLPEERCVFFTARKAGGSSTASGRARRSALRWWGRRG